MEIKFLSLTLLPFEEEVKVKSESFYQTKEKYSSFYKKSCELNESNKLLKTKIEVNKV